MREAGLRTWQDGVGNVHGRLDGGDREAPALLLGSHYDTVTDAGKFDGALGIVVAIAAVKAALLQVGFARSLTCWATCWADMLRAHACTLWHPNRSAQGSLACCVRMHAPVGI
jgi:hypothetical protein